VLLGWAPPAVKAGEPPSRPDLSVLTDRGQAGVGAATLVGNTLVIGGTFSRVWYRTGPGSILTGSTGQADRLTSEFRGGAITAVVNDGDGGWYVGGAFTQVGPTAGVSRLAHIAKDGAVDTTWAPNPDAQVRALAVDGAGNVVVGGDFTHIGETSAARNRLAAVDAATGEATAWDPNMSAIVAAVAVGPDDTVYAGGAFTTVGGAATARNRLASFAAGTRALTAWDPSVNNNTVNTLVATASAVYAGGTFTTVGTGPTPRNRLASFAPGGAGAVDPWNPNMQNAVNALAIAPDGTLYAGGTFISSNGTTRNRLAAFSTANGTLTAWNPNATTGAVNAIAVDPVTAGSVYVGGTFDTVGGQSRPRMARIGSDGLATLWAPAPYTARSVTGGTAVPVSALASSGGRTFAGGSFLGLNGVSRTRGAAIDLTDGSILPFNPKVADSFNLGGDSISYLAPGANGTVYVAGGFDTIGATPVARSQLARLSLATSEATSAWNPSPDRYISALSVGASGRVYVGGGFSNIGGLPRDQIAALDPVNGSAIAGWNPGVQSPPFGFAESPDQSTVYVGGDFTTIGTPPVSRPRIAALSAGDGSIDLAFNPAPNDRVRGILPSADGTTVAVGGDFTDIGGTDSDADPLTRAPGVALVNADSGLIDGHSPRGSEFTYAIARGDAAHLFAGGSFNVAGPPPQVSRLNAAGFVADAGGDFVLSAFDPALTLPVQTMVAGTGNAVYLGGLFETPLFTAAFASYTPVPTAADRLTPPAINGAVTVGATLSVTPGTWSSTTPLGHRYQWRRCDDEGCTPVGTGTSHVLGGADAGHYLVVRDTLVTVSGEDTVQSSPSNTLAVLSGPSGLGLGTVVVGELGDDHTVTVTNDSDDTVQFGAVTVAGADAAAVAVSAGGCADASLAPAATCAVHLRLVPVHGGAQTAELRIPSDAPDSPLSVALTGTATTRTLSASTPLDLGTVVVGQNGETRSVTVTSTGTVSAQLDVVTVAGADAAAVQVTADGCGGATLAPLATCTVQLRLVPMHTGAQAAELWIGSNAPASPLAVALTGTGASPAGDPQGAPDATAPDVTPPAGGVHWPAPTAAEIASRALDFRTVYLLGKAGPARFYGRVATRRRRPVSRVTLGVGVCARTACTLSPVMTLSTRFRDGSTRRRTTRPAPIELAAGTAGFVTMRLTTSDLRAIRRAQSASVRLVVTVGVQRFVRTYRVRTG
jgi:hypothetical protein